MVPGIYGRSVMGAYLENNIVPAWVNRGELQEIQKSWFGLSRGSAKSKMEIKKFVKENDDMFNPDYFTPYNCRCYDETFTLHSFPGVVFRPMSVTCTDTYDTLASCQKEFEIKGYAYDEHYEDPLCQRINISPIQKQIEHVFGVERIVFNDPATIVFWKDHTKTVVKCQPGTEFNPYFGFCAALAKKMYGSNSKINKVVDYWMPKNEGSTKKVEEKDPTPDDPRPITSDEEKESEPFPVCVDCKYMAIFHDEEPCKRCIGMDHDDPTRKNMFEPKEEHVCKTCKYRDVVFADEPCMTCIGDSIQETIRSHGKNSNSRPKWEPRGEEIPQNITNTEYTGPKFCYKCKHFQVPSGEEPCKSCHNKSLFEYNGESED